MSSPPAIDLDMCVSENIIPVVSGSAAAIANVFMIMKRL